MYEEIARLVGLDNELTDKHFKLLISWFVAAAHGKDRKSILNMEMLAAATSVPSFHKWANIWLGCTMGREETKCPVPTMGAPPHSGATSHIHNHGRGDRHCTGHHTGPPATKGGRTNPPRGNTEVRKGVLSTLRQHMGLSVVVWQKGHQQQQ